jgi:type IX secretion system PorP/SprF family membrane protein
MNYRDQWPALKGTFVTTSASYDQYVDALQGGLGVFVINDKAGTGAINSTSVSGAYSYQLPLSKTVAAKIGLEATYVQKNFDRSKLTFGDQIEDRAGFVDITKETIPSEKKEFADFSSGVIVYSSSVYGGIAVSHLTQPVESFNFSSAGQSRLPIKYTVHVGAVIPLGKDKKNASSYIAPNILYVQQKEFNQLNLGMYLGKGALVGGLWYRTSVGKGSNFLGSDSFIILLGIQQGIFKLGYSYDITVSKLANSSAGSHEISLGLQFECKPKKKKFRAIKCPTF